MYGLRCRVSLTRSIMALSLDDIRTLFDRHGDIAYSGEPVTQLEHALQTAALAEAAAAPARMIPITLVSVVRSS